MTFDPSRASRPNRRVRPLIVAVTILIIVGVSAAAWITIRQLQVQRSVYAKILDQKLATTSRQFRYYLQPITDDLTIMVEWWHAGLLDPTRPERIPALIAPLLTPHQQIVAAYIIPPEGPLYRLVRQNGHWESPPVVAGGSDPRHSAWFEAALQTNSDHPVAWSDYRDLPGVAGRGLLTGQATGDGTVLAVAILKRDLDQFSATAPITENGILVRRLLDGSVTWLAPGAGGSLATTGSGELLVSDRPEHSVISKALLAWGRRNQPYEQAFTFKVGRKTWWASCYRSVPGTDPGELFLIAPASDLSRRLETVTGRVSIIFAVVLALAMITVVALAFDYREKWRRISRRRRPAPTGEQDLRALIAAGESLQVEFKSTMRWNLHADKAGKEIEIAWLKTVVAYLNTNGGFLLIGVADDGGILGLEADNFPNEDKFLLHFDNLIQRHIGLQFAGWIHAEFHSLGGRRIFLINCDRCQEPVFLKKGDEEMFYIRVGASSRQLPASRIFDYLEDRAP